MKLIVAVVGDEYVGKLSEGLTRGGFGATKLASTGGFLRAGNTTFLIGVPVDQVDAAMAVIRDACPPGDRHHRTAAKGPEGVPAVQVGKATVFVLDVPSMLKV
ncbi:MAG: cyclic-di-AMP receptor [Mycobacterium leprae]